MNPAITLPISMAVCLLCGMARKMYSSRWSERTSDRHVYNAVASLVSAVVLFLWGGFGKASVFTLLLGVGFGIVTALQQISVLKALKLGSWAYTSVITTLSTLIPALSGRLFWEEKLLWPQIVGMILMVGCIFLSVEKEKEKKALSVKWLLYCGVAFLCTGLIGVMQKIHQSSSYKEELNAFLVVAFAVSFLYSAMSFLVTSRKDGKAERPGKEWAIMLLVMAAGGACAAVNNKLNLYLSGVMPSAVFFPLVNGGNLVLTTLVAVLAFREKLSVKQWIGMALGTASVIFLCNPFQ